MDKQTIAVLKDLIDILLVSDTNNEHGHTHKTFDGTDIASLRQLSQRLNDQTQQEDKV